MAQAPVADVADHDDRAPLHALAAARRLVPPALATRDAPAEAHREGLAARGPCLWPVRQRQLTPRGVLGPPVRIPAELLIVGAVAGDDGTVAIEDHDGLAHAVEDERQAHPLHLALLALLLE